MRRMVWHLPPVKDKSLTMPPLLFSMKMPTPVALCVEVETLMVNHDW
jgi:hypothetical protein